VLHRHIIITTTTTLVISELLLVEGSLCAPCWKERVLVAFFRSVVVVVNFFQQLVSLEYQLLLEFALELCALHRETFF